MSSLAQQIESMRNGAAVLHRPDVRTLHLAGPDAVRFLNGMVTSDVSKLEPFSGVAAVKTTNRGRVEGVLRARKIENGFLLDVLAVAASRVKDSLERHIIMDDCTISDVSAERAVVSVLGPRASALLGAPELKEHAFADVRAPFEGTLIRDSMMGLGGYECHVVNGLAERLLKELTDRGAVLASPEALDVARIEAGIPLDGKDIDDDTIPMEARLERAIDFHKGCYVGQEVIARATNLGGIKHILVGLFVEGDVIPLAGAPLIYGQGGSEERTGEVTSAARSPTLGRTIALGYVRRIHEAEGTKLSIGGAEGAPAVLATVARLPFVGS